MKTVRKTKNSVFPIFIFRFAFLSVLSFLCFSSVHSVYADIIAVSPPEMSFRSDENSIIFIMNPSSEMIEFMIDENPYFVFSENRGFVDGNSFFPVKISSAKNRKIKENIKVMVISENPDGIPLGVGVEIPVEVKKIKENIFKIFFKAKYMWPAGIVILISFFMIVLFR